MFLPQIPQTPPWLSLNTDSLWVVITVSLPKPKTNLLIMVGTMTLDYDEDDSDYMGDNGKGTDSSEDDISLEDEKDMELGYETLVE